MINKKKNLMDINDKNYLQKAQYQKIIFNKKIILVMLKKFIFSRRRRAVAVRFFNLFFITTGEMTRAPIGAKTQIFEIFKIMKMLKMVSTRSLHGNVIKRNFT